MKKIIYSILFLLFLTLTVQGADLNYSKTVQVQFPLTIDVNNDNNQVSIILPNQTLVYSTLSNSRNNISPIVNYVVKEADCPSVADITNPIITKLNATNISDLNKIIDYVKDANTYATSCSDTMQSKVNQLNDSLGGFASDLKSYMENTIAPTQEDFQNLEGDYRGCQIDYKELDKNLGTCNAQLESATVQRDTYRDQATFVQNTQDDTSIILIIIIIVLFLSTGILLADKYGFIDKFKGREN